MDSDHAIVRATVHEAMATARVKWKLRDYQARDVKAILARLRTDKRIVYCLPVAGGKTRVAVEVMRQIPGAVLVLAHRGELLDQMLGVIALAGIDPASVDA